MEPAGSSGFLRVPQGSSGFLPAAAALGGPSPARQPRVYKQAGVQGRCHRDVYRSCPEECKQPVQLLSDTLHSPAATCPRGPTMMVFPSWRRGRGHGRKTEARRRPFDL